MYELEMCNRIFMRISPYGSVCGGKGYGGPAGLEPPSVASAVRRILCFAAGFLPGGTLCPAHGTRPAEHSIPRFFYAL